MTSDAKIGLLLGLVFIFIIAFVVNGLPRLRSEPDSNELTVISAEGVVSPDTPPPGIGVRQREAEGVLTTWSTSSSDETSTGEPFDAAGQIPEPEEETAWQGPDDGVRFGTDLPQEPPVVEEEGFTLYRGTPTPRFGPSMTTGNETVELASREQEVDPLAKYLNSPPSEETFVEPETSNPMLTHPSLTEVSGVGIAGNTMDSESAEAEGTTGRTWGTQRTAQNPRETPTATRRNRAGRSNWPKKYTVTEGDTLAGIAKKFYGNELGNVRANIDHIYKVNTDVLDSPHMVIVGQELKIPALPDNQRATPADGAFPESLVETADSVGRRRQNPSTNTIRFSGRHYVAKEGDSLWKIAASELGKGSRYTEIFELNNDIMKDPANVVPGMRLRMPGK